jgi:recombination protein RecR
MSLNSKILQEITSYFHSFPGVGKKTALRYTIQLLQQDRDFIQSFGKALLELPDKITECSVCFNISETPICNICTSEKRDNSIICVVQDIRDVIAIENTQQFKGKFHVLGGIISPMDGIGPKDLKIEELIERISKNEATKEIILALPSTMEGDTTCFYIFKKIQTFSCTVSTIARGISFGDQIEFADEITLGKSILNRVLYDNGPH